MSNGCLVRDDRNSSGILAQQRGAESQMPPAPLLASAHTGWKEMRLERHRMGPVDDMTSTIEGYQVCLIVGGPVPMRWKTNGREFSRVLQTKELCTATHGELRSVSWRAPLEMLLCSISPKLMRDLSASEGRSRCVELIKIRGVRDAQIETLLRMLQADLIAGCPAGPLYGEQLGTALAIYLLRRFSAAGSEQKKSRAVLPGHLLRKIFEYVEENLGERIALDEIAGLTQINRFYFSKLFRNATGQSPCQYILERRVERAKEMLKKSLLSLDEIAQKTGFANQSHFTFLFHRRTGSTPARYRSFERSRQSTVFPEHAGLMNASHYSAP